MEHACKIHGIDIQSIYPKDIDGITRPLGVFVDEGLSVIFKTIGAKRYLHIEKYDRNNPKPVIKRTHMVTSGVNSKTALPYMWEKAGHNIIKLFQLFDDELIIPAEYSGKNVHTYIDVPRHGKVTDYLGNEYAYTELSGIHLSQSSYDFSRVSDFKKFVEQLESELFEL